MLIRRRALLLQPFPSNPDDASSHQRLLPTIFATGYERELPLKFHVQVELLITAIEHGDSRCRFELLFSFIGVYPTQRQSNFSI